MPSVEAYRVMVRRYLETRLAGRSGADRRRIVLDLHADLTGRGHPEPEKALAAALGVPVKTVRRLLERPPG